MLLPEILLLTRENGVILALGAILKRYADTREPITLPRPAISESKNRGEKSSRHFAHKYFAFPVLQLNVVKAETLCEYLMRRLDFVGSACSSSVFLWMKTFFMVLASYARKDPLLRLKILHFQES